MPDDAMNDSIYWAHSARSGDNTSSDRTGWQRLAVHLEAVSTLAEVLAGGARPGDANFTSLARLGGLLHDFGKYSDNFQRMLKTGQGRCQHAIHGALLTFFGANAGSGRPALSHVASVIAGHHAGLYDLTGDEKSLSTRFQERKFQDEVQDLLERAVMDSDALRSALSAKCFGIQRTAAEDAAEFDLLTRMLFSCIVDADRSDSAGCGITQAPLAAEQRLKQLLDHLDSLAGRAPDGLVKRMRKRVLDDCLAAASGAGPMFSLSVPTGGGKTLAAMAFAMRRAALYPERFRRVIVVIPYLSIIEQNAQVYADVFGPDAVLEHHSGSLGRVREQKGKYDARAEEQLRYVPVSDDDMERLDQLPGQRTETENWDAPLIVTTSVRFFESLFSNRPRDLRRVHNIARSIVILDEVQTVPRRLLGPLLGIMRELADGWGVNFVFSTATQPAFERPAGKSDLRWSPGTVTEIVRDPEPLRQALRRVEIRWEIEHTASWPQLAERMLAAEQCLAIVNLRRHASELYGELKRLALSDGVDLASVFHLSTRMCAAHRLRVLARIRERLAANMPCFVVSTQLVEAGVDVDFPLVLRALAPLDSIVQAAGRADREGTRTAVLGRPGGEVVVFRPEDDKMPPNEYAEAAGFTEVLARDALRQCAGIQVDSADAMAAYFERYYGSDGSDGLGAELVELRAGAIGKFATLADHFEMISSRTRDVFVPDDEESRACLAELQRTGDLTVGLRHRLQRHVVGLSPSEFARASGVLIEQPLGSGVWLAVDQAYDEEMGLLLELKREQLVL